MANLGAEDTVDSANERRTGRPSRERVAEIDEIVLDTAASMFLEQGSSVSMKAIVTATGLSSKTVYARYPNKAALLPAALRHLLQRVGPGDQALISGNIRQDLHAFVLKALRGTYGDATATLANLLRIEPAYARDLRIEIAAAVDRNFTGPLVRMLDMAKVDGAVRNVDSHAVARAIIAVLLAEPTARLSADLPPPSVKEIEAQATFVATLISDGVCR